MAKLAHKLKSGNIVAFFNKYFPLVILTLMIVVFFFKKQKSNILDYSANNDFEESNITPSIAQSLAEQLYTAMRYFGTDEQSIINVFNQVNENGALMVFNAFGLRTYSQTFGISSNYNLTDWLRSELSETDPAYILAKLKLSPNGLL